MKNNLIFDYVQRKNVWYCLTSIVWVHFSLKIEKLWFWKSLKYFNTVRFEYAPWKNIWFCLLPMFGFILVIKLRNSDFESHWNALIDFDKKKMFSDLNISHENISDFVSFPLFTFTLDIKLRIFDLKGH